MPDPDLVLIEWEDSVQPLSEWQWLREANGPNIIRCRTVGWLLSRDERELRVAMSLGDGADDNQVAGIMAIPARSVLECRSLRPTSSFPSEPVD